MRLDRRLILLGLIVLGAFGCAPRVRTAETIAFETETLSNGLKVIYAPMKNTPAVHVRVLYHVGSKDERPDRQGFAHMFEHMMFRGSEHVQSEQHMKLVMKVGGMSNAFTNCDETVYINTVPAGEVDLPLWLEADRMSSFKVLPAIFSTERQVVSEEWRLRQNQPYGTLREVLQGMMFTKHHYHWTTIGNMDQLAAANPAELQDFFARYYVPNNAVLVIAGNIDVKAVREAVHRYYGWILRGADIVRESPPEPEQTEARRRDLPLRVPLARVLVDYPMPKRIDDDQDALNILLRVLGDGRSSRLSQALVTGKDPLCTRADTSGANFEDGGMMGVSATVLEGKSPAEVERIVREQIALIRQHPPTAEELAKAKVQARLDLVNRRDTAMSVATELGDEMLFRGDLSHVKTAQERIDAVTAADVLRVAKKYLADGRSTTVVVTPDPKAPLGVAPEGLAAVVSPAPATPLPARPIVFPADYPTQPPLSPNMPSAVFEKGVEKSIDGAQVIVMTDRRLPIVHWLLTFGGGSFREPAGKTGLGAITASMVRRGPGGTTYNAFNETLESHGITLDVASGVDVTAISGNCLADQLAFAVELMGGMIRRPAFDPTEFEHVKTQALSDARMSLDSPTVAADRELNREVFGENFLGWYPTPETIGAITLDDVKQYFAAVTYGPSSRAPILMLAGDLSVEDGQKLAHLVLADLRARDKTSVPAVEVKPPPTRRIILLDRPESRQANIRAGIAAYDLHSEDRYAGALAGQILSSGIDSRLGRYVRAQKGLAYGVGGIFAPTRLAGMFRVNTDTKIESATDAVEACFKVLEEMEADPVTSQELGDAKLRAAGLMLMGMQTIWQQAQRRIDGILNDYPVDYYDLYAGRIAKVTGAEIRDLMRKDVDLGRMTIVVVGPAATLKDKLARLGEVEVRPMPLDRAK